MDGLLYKVGLRQGKEGAPAATAAATHRHRPSQTAGSKKRNSNQGHHRHQGSFNNDAHAHRRTLSSMTTNTSGMAPSQPHHTHHQGSRSRTILTSRLWRRSIFLICCSLLAWAVYQQRFASTSSSSSTSTSLAFAQGAAGSKKSSSYPFARSQFKLVDPVYEVLVLRSSIQHQDETWRSVVTRNGNAWLLQSVAWIRVINGVRPELNAVKAWCKPAPSDSDGSQVDDLAIHSSKAEVKVLWTDYRDRGIDQDTMLWLECDATPLLRRKFNASTALPRDAFTREDVDKLTDFQLDFAFEHDLGEVSTSTSGQVPLNLFYMATDIDVAVHKPLPRVKISACLSPAFYEPGQMPLLRWLEWREHMRRIGTERVNWYGRDKEMARFVQAYNRLTDAQDIFRWAPPLGDQGDSVFNNPYHDQDAWYSDCVLANRQSSDYLSILDVDEYPMVDFDNTTHTPKEQWLSFLGSLPPDRGMWEMKRIPISNKRSHGKPNKNNLIQDELTCVNGLDERVKSFYRSNTVMTANQHKRTRMYPLGEELAKQYKARPERPYWEMPWDSAIRSQWPKLFHYRWFPDNAENGCTDRLPMDGSPGYKKFLDSLRKDVFELKAKIERELGMQ